MSELVKKLNNGEVVREAIADITSIPFNELLKDDTVVSFQVIKNLEVMDTPPKNSISSIRRKDMKEEQRRKQSEHTALRQMKKEYLSKRNASLPDRYMILLSGLTTKSQEVFWVLYDAIDKIDCNTIASKCHSKVVTVNCAIKELKESGLIIRIGSKKTGHYEIAEDILMSIHNR